MFPMKAAIEFDETLYRQLKVEAARRGRTIHELVDEGMRHVPGLPIPPAPGESTSDPEWFGTLREYAGNAAGEHDLPSIRRSIAAGRTPPQ